MTLKRARTALDALLQLGPSRLAELAGYRIGLRSGLYRRLEPRPAVLSQPVGALNLQAGPALPTPQKLAQVLGSQAQALTSEADEIISGKARLFGAAPVPLNLAPPLPARHWTDYESGQAAYEVGDIKFTWEPARFGWAVILARAYRLSADQGYAQSFFQHLDSFLAANPPYLGANWTSAQEAALRLISLAFACRVMGAHPGLAQVISAHAQRIPPTLLYARAQDNNHLLSEAVGLYTAATLLPEHPHTQHWRSLGWRWMNHCFQHQFAPDGTYIQHSANYHRMALQLALWAFALVQAQGQRLPPQSLEKLAAGTHWLVQRMDPTSGRLPNLGHNDGAHILPLAVGGFEDYRPTAQAASRAFLGGSALPAGAWDEMSLWLGLAEAQPGSVRPVSQPLPAALILRQPGCWASLRAVQYTSRPGQADLLHVDLWRQGEPITLDAGTYQYNAAPPWQNALAGSAVHNTVTVEGQDQMRRAGRFLWLDWPRVSILPPSAGRLMLLAAHEGYLKRFKVVHQRQVSAPSANTWLVEDELLRRGGEQALALTLHWLLPDFPFQLNGSALDLQTAHGLVRVAVSALPEHLIPEVQVIRAGQTLIGKAESSPVFGWYSPTYGVRLPALAFRCTWNTNLSIKITTRFTFDAPAPKA